MGKMNRNCIDCCFSMYAASGNSRAVLICKQRQLHVGKWTQCDDNKACIHFYRFSSRAAPKARVIPLTKGKFAIVDADDYERFGRFKWHAKEDVDTCYAGRKEKGKHLKLHREIMGAPKGMIVDHIDHDGLNNRKENLRVCSLAENSRNKKSRKTGSSKYKGVHWHKTNGKYTALIGFEGKKYHLGSFDDEIDAAKAYDKKASLLFGEFAYLNFPKSKLVLR